MARPHFTYRAARRNRFIRDKIGDSLIRLNGSNWRQPFDDDPKNPIVKHRPAINLGWNYRLGSLLPQLKPALNAARRRLRRERHIDPVRRS